MNVFKKFTRVLSSVPFGTLDNSSHFDKNSLYSKATKWVPQPQPSTPTKPIFPKWVKGFLFGGYASLQPPDKPPDDPHNFYGSKVFTISQLRGLFSEYDNVPTMSNDEWIESIFKNLHVDALQATFRESAQKEQKRLNLSNLPFEHKLIITDGTIEDFKADVQSTKIKEKYITLSGVEETVKDSDELMGMRGTNNHHATVNQLNVPNPETNLTSNRLVRKSEWTSKRYRILAGVYNPKYKWKPKLKVSDGGNEVSDGYEIHLLEEVVVLNEMDPKHDKPKSILGYWWRPLCSEIRTTYDHIVPTASPPRFSGKQVLEYILKTPLIRLTYGVFRFHMENRVNSGYGYHEEDHVRWEDLPHPNQDDYETSLRANRHRPNRNYDPEYDCKGTREGFLFKHVRTIPGVVSSGNGRSAIHIDSIERLFSLSDHEYDVIKSLSASVLIIPSYDFNVQQMRLLPSPQVPPNGDSITQPFPSGCQNVYSTWDLNKGFPVIVTQKEGIATNIDPWMFDKTKFRERVDLEKKFGGIREIAIGHYALVERSFLLWNWHTQLYLDIQNSEPRHMESLYPIRIHSNTNRRGFGKPGFTKLGANGVAGGLVPFEMELLPMFPRTHQFHRCPDPSTCPRCPSKKGADKEGKEEKTSKFSPVLDFIERNFSGLL